MFARGVAPGWTGGKDEGVSEKAAFEECPCAVRCTEGVSRRGEYQPCDKPAVAWRIDLEYLTEYPVCKHHTRGDMVPLAASSPGGTEE